MVSKVAVLAIVGILAVPILLGYALNVQQTTENDYRTTGDPVNVTQLLQTGTDYGYVNADTYQLNTNFISPTGSYSAYPIYQNVTYTKTSLPLQEFQYYTEPGGFPRAKVPLSTWSFMYFQSDITSSSTNYLTLVIYDLNDAPLVVVSKITAFYWNIDLSMVYYSYYQNGQYTNGQAYIADPAMNFQFSETGTYDATGYLIRQHNTDTFTNYTYADISSGFRLKTTNRFNLPPYSISGIKAQLPDFTRSVLLTFNLDTITDSSYDFGIAAGRLVTCHIVKSDLHGEEKWYGKFHEGYFDLYYDPNRSDNTYQLYVTADYLYSYENNGNTINVYNTHMELRYVGGWSKTIGPANSFIVYSQDLQSGFIAPNSGIDYVEFSSTANNGLTPTIRIDEAEFRGNTYQVIANNTYSPASFKQNPSTTITNIERYGESLTFGGNTYTVSKEGKITIDGHDVSIKDLKFNSIPSELGGYDNRIGNTVISTSAQPSTITFNGSWSASVATTAQEEYEITKTEWKAGDFAWDGMDQNFIMAGLLASLGAFIGVGIYARRTKATVWPLLIVCGGAALLFFVML